MNWKFSGWVFSDSDRELFGSESIGCADADATSARCLVLIFHLDRMLKSLVLHVEQMLVSQCLKEMLFTGSLSAAMNLTLLDD